MTAPVQSVPLLQHCTSPEGLSPSRVCSLAAEQYPWLGQAAMTPPLTAFPGQTVLFRARLASDALLCWAPVAAQTTDHPSSPARRLHGPLRGGGWQQVGGDKHSSDLLQRQKGSSLLEWARWAHSWHPGSQKLVLVSFSSKGNC